MDEVVVTVDPASLVPTVAVSVDTPEPVELVMVAEQGPPGPPGPTADIKTINGQTVTGIGDLQLWLAYEQVIPSDTWTVTHNLNKFPSVTVVDSAGSWVIGAVAYVDLNTVRITFSSSFSGRAFFN